MYRKRTIRRMEGSRHYLSEFVCECGKKFIKRSDTKAKSCGCKRRKEVVIHSHGYKLIRVRGKLVYEHRYKIEQKIGRKLKRTEQVHHKNEIKTDNRLSNLVLCKDAQEHNRYNNGWVKDRHGRWWKKCPNCKKFKLVESNFYRGKKQYFFTCKTCPKTLIKSL